MARPNILFYCTDQQRFDTIGALGNSHVKTPRLDQLVGQGTAFTHAYCQSPICTPSRSSFMTGLYPSKVHNTRNGNGTFPLEAPPLISKLLADSGYVCGNIGKFHLTSSAKRTEPRLDDGYSYWKFSHAPRDDWEFARLMNHLEESGQKENTLVVFTSDHGEMLGDHGLLWKGCRFYEGLVRVPLIFSMPGVVQQNIQANGFVELLDLSATILDYAQVAIPDYFQGQSLRPVLEGKESGEVIRESVRCEYFDSLDSHFTGGSGAFATMYRKDRYKLCLYHGIGTGELYDMEKDPWEHENLWDSQEHLDLKNKLIFESSNQHVLLTTDVGSSRIARY